MDPAPSADGWPPPDDARDDVAPDVMPDVAPDLMVARIPTEVTVTIPPSARWIRVARLVATGVGSTCSYGVDALEDLRIAVDEACGLLIERQPPGPVTVSFASSAGDDPNMLDVEVSCPMPTDASGPQGFGVDVLTAVSESWAWAARDGRLAVTIRMTDRAVALD